MEQIGYAFIIAGIMLGFGALWSWYSLWHKNSVALYLGGWVVALVYTGLLLAKYF